MQFKICLVAPFAFMVLAGCSQMSAGPKPGAALSSAVETGISTPKPTGAHQPQQSPNNSRGGPLSEEELLKLAGNPCQTPLDGGRCRSEESDFDVTPDCWSQARYAVVTRVNGTNLLSRVPPQNNLIRAVLSVGQLVCVQSVAWIGRFPSYMFVTAIAKPKGDCTACGEFGDRAIQWKASHPATACAQVAPGRFSGGCATGWVDGDDMRLIETTK